MKTVALLLSLIAAAMVMSGCGGPYRLGTTRSYVHGLMPSLERSIETGVTKRADVQAQFGTPILQKNDLRLEAYRVASGHDVTWTLFPPLPPLIWPSDLSDVGLYLLVLYDELDFVKKFDWGLHEEPWPKTLVVEDFELHISSYYELLTLGSAASKRALHDPPPNDACRLTIAHTGYGEVLLDDKLLINKVFFYAPLGYFQMDLEPGEHVLNMYRLSTKKFTCPPGVSRYGYLDDESVEVEENLPEHFLHLKKLLYYSGKWVK